MQYENKAEGSRHKRQRALWTLDEPHLMAHSPRPLVYSHLPCYSFPSPHVPAVANRAPSRSLYRSPTKVLLTTPKKQFACHTNPERKVTHFLNRASFYFQILGTAPYNLVLSPLTLLVLTSET